MEDIIKESFFFLFFSVLDMNPIRFKLMYYDVIFMIIIFYHYVKASINFVVDNIWTQVFYLTTNNFNGLTNYDPVKGANWEDGNRCTKYWFLFSLFDCYVFILIVEQEN